jgi:hypothetical protein
MCSGMFEHVFIVLKFLFRPENRDKFQHSCLEQRHKIVLHHQMQGRGGREREREAKAHQLIQFHEHYSIIELINDCQTQK